MHWTRLLTIIANSMLATTTSTLTVMVSVHRSVALAWTPRAHRVLLQDTTTQTVLATFMGANIYAVAGIILMNTPLFDAREILALYLTTVMVIVLIVLVILRWILHLQSLGSLMDTTARIEAETVEQMREALFAPCLGARPWTDAAPPDGAMPVLTQTSACIQEIYQNIVQEAARSCDGEVWIEVPVGRFVRQGEVIAWIRPGVPGLAQAVERSVHTGPLRTAAQDPRFGLIQLAKFGSKALSPGINDPGTAIDIVGRLTRLLMTRCEAASEPRHDRLWVRALSPDDLIEDAFAALSRDTGAAVEVHIALIKTLNALSTLAEPGIANAARRYAPIALQRAREDVRFAPDRDRLPAATE